MVVNMEFSISEGDPQARWIEKNMEHPQLKWMMNRGTPI